MRTLIDFGHQIRLPDMEYWEYLVNFFNENNLIFHLTKNTNCITSFQKLEGSVRYELDNLTQDEISTLINLLNNTSIIRSYDKTFIIKHDIVSDTCIGLTLIDYDRI